MDASSIRRMIGGARSVPGTLTGLALPLILLVFAGCSGSGDGSGSAGDATRSGVQPTGEVDRWKAPEFPPGKFTVQLGAFQSEEGAETIASLTRSRFSKEVYAVFNDADGLYKVMLGIFDTKDQARGFRDSIVRQFPDDYRDAWVSELTR